MFCLLILEDMFAKSSKYSVTWQSGKEISNLVSEMDDFSLF